MKLLLARHGQTSLNAQGRFLGRVNDPLDDVGMRQVATLAARLENERIDAIVSSDLTRATQTAVAIANPHGLTVQVDLDLREIAMGAWEGQLIAEIKKTQPHLFEQWLADPVQYYPTGGESLEGMRLRLQRALSHWQERYPTRPGAPEPTVVWVTHSAFIGVLLCHLLNLPLVQMRLFYTYNASLSIVHLVPKRVGTQTVLYSLNETGHLWERGFGPKPPYAYLYLPQD